MPKAALGSEQSRELQGKQKFYYGSNIMDSPYKVCRIPNKGEGLVATTDIARGQLILSEEPIFQYTDPRFNDRAEAFRRYNKLDRPKQKKVWKLFDVTGNRNRSEDLELVMQTNGIRLRDLMYGLFEIACRINHSCRPNTHSSWDPVKETIEIYATKNILQGEEITSTYIGNLARYALRRVCLKHIFKFTCRCWLCTLPEEDREMSDLRIQEINDLLKQEISMLGQIRELLQLYDLESIVGWQPVEAYKGAWLLASRSGYKTRARIFAERGAKLCAEIEGFDGVDTVEWRKRVMDCGDEDEEMPEDEEGFEEWLFGELEVKENVNGWGDKKVKEKIDGPGQPEAKESDEGPGEPQVKKGDDGPEEPEVKENGDGPGESEVKESGDARGDRV
ncbi:unnamed protein product [Clonostachys rosea]|uniref:SET domain-containing protein n=1 Tax=Bionectria ochroleuca TaxID=29856 RepID=A0ABY6TQ24_BIOOC|nr:unnamed protein product [Clonostachys rosea]